MYKQVGYMVGYMAVLVSMCAYNYITGQSMYSALVQIVESRVQHFLVCMFVVLVTYVAMRSAIKGWIGELTPLEIESVQEYSLKYIANMCLVVTLFADHMSTNKLMVFGIIFALKALSWVVALKIDGAEKGSGYTKEEAAKMLCTCTVLGVINTALLGVALRSALSKPGMSIIFACELAQIAAQAVKCGYSVWVLVVVQNKPIEQRIFMMFYGEFVLYAAKIAIQVVCLLWTTLYYRIPINLLREVMEIVKYLITKTKVIMAYKRLLAELDKYPDIQRTELGENNTCLICHEEMEEAKKLVCGHFFHLQCLKEWLHRQQVCPVCRKEVAQEKQTESANSTRRSEAREGVRIHFGPGEAEYEGIPVTLQ